MSLLTDKLSFNSNEKNNSNTSNSVFFKNRNIESDYENLNQIFKSEEQKDQDFCLEPLSGIELLVKTEIESTNSVDSNLILENSYIQNTKFKKKFNISEFNDSLKDNDIDFVFKYRVPARPYIKKNDEFDIYFQIINTTQSNALIKFVSEDFYFSKSMFVLNREEQKVSLKKREDKSNYNIFVKVFIDNVISKQFNVNLWDRTKWL